MSFDAIINELKVQIAELQNWRREVEAEKRDILVNSEEAAIYLGCSNLTVHKLCANGILPHIRNGRYYRIKVSALDKLKAANPNMDKKLGWVKKIIPVTE